MSAQYIHRGDSIDHTPSSDVAQNAVVVQGTLFGVATRAIPANTTGALAVTGVFSIAKPTGAGTDWAAGTAVYWDAGNTRLTTTVGSNVYVGKTVAAALTTDARVNVRLSQ
jgi:predicted RecA/RadA family phage recombinase